MTMLLRIVTVPPLTGNFNIQCAVDGMARIFLIPVLPIIPLCWDGDWITMKFIHAENALHHLSLPVGISGLSAKWFLH
ncbi:hypothetical protein Tco_1436460 [Tanacetum coccineum]